MIPYRSSMLFLVASVSCLNFYKFRRRWQVSRLKIIFKVECGYLRNKRTEVILFIMAYVTDTWYVTVALIPTLFQYKYLPLENSTTLWLASSTLRFLKYATWDCWDMLALLLTCLSKRSVIVAPSVRTKALSWISTAMGSSLLIPEFCICAADTDLVSFFYDLSILVAQVDTSQLLVLGFTIWNFAGFGSVVLRYFFLLFSTAARRTTWRTFYVRLRCCGWPCAEYNTFFSAMSP